MPSRSTRLHHEQTTAAVVTPLAAVLAVEAVITRSIYAGWAGVGGQFCFISACHTTRAGRDAGLECNARHSAGLCNGR